MFQRLTFLLVFIGVHSWFTASAFAQTNIYATLTVTNVLGITNGNSLTVAGTSFLVTNSTVSVRYISPTNTAGAAATNLANKLAAALTNQYFVSYGSPTSIVVRPFTGGSVSLTTSTNWAIVRFATNTGLAGGIKVSNVIGSSFTLLGSSPETITNWSQIGGGSGGGDISTPSSNNIVAQILAGDSNVTAAVSFPITFPATNSPLFSIMRAAFSTNMLTTNAQLLPRPFTELKADVAGDVLMVAGGTNIWVFSLTNRALPVLKASIGSATTNRFIAHSGGFFYVASDGYISVYNCAIASAPVLVSSNSIGASNIVMNMSVKDGLLIAGTQVTGNVAPGYLLIFSLNNPSAPALLSQTSFGNITVRDALKIGSLLYIADYTGKTLKVADISNPRSPVVIHSQAMADHGDYATFEPFRLMAKPPALYVADDNTLQIFNITNPTNPVYASDIQISVDDPAGPFTADVEAAYVEGDFLFWGMPGNNDENPGQLVAYDLLNPLLPTRLTAGNLSTAGGYNWFAVGEDYLYQPSLTADNTSNVLAVLNKPKLPRFTASAQTMLIDIATSVTLPPAAQNVGRILTVKVVANGTQILSASGTDRIEGAATYTLTNGQAATFISDGLTNWFEIGRKKEVDPFTITSLASTNNVKGTTNWVLVIQGANSFWTNVIPAEMVSDRAPTNAPNLFNATFSGRTDFNGGVTTNGIHSYAAVNRAIYTIGATNSGLGFNGGAISIYNAGTVVADFKTSPSGLGIPNNTDASGTYFALSSFGSRWVERSRQGSFYFTNMFTASTAVTNETFGEVKALKAGGNGGNIYSAGQMVATNGFVSPTNFPGLGVITNLTGLNGMWRGLSNYADVRVVVSNGNTIVTIIP